MDNNKEKNPNIIVDTNVIVSAFLSSKEDTATVLVLKRIYKREVNLCYSQEILNEYIDVLNRDKFRFNKNEIKKFIDFVVKNCHKEKPKEIEEKLIDVKDKPFYELVEFMQSKKAILVTGNIKHFPVKDYIVTPNDFMLLN